MNRLIFIFLVNLTGSLFAESTLTFPQALALAYQHNPQLRIAIDQANTAKGNFIQSGQYPNPLVLLAAENIGGSGVYSGFESAETTLSVTQPIALGNRLQASQQAACADYKAMLAAIRIQKMRIYTQVGLAYVDSLYAEQWYVVTRKLTELNQTVVKEINRRTTAGAGAELDLRLAEVQLGEAKIQQQRAKQEALFAWAKLERAVGMTLPQGRHLTDSGLSHKQVTWSALLKKLPNSPSLIEKQLKLSAQRKTITAVKKDVWPNLLVQVGARHFSDDGSNAAIVSTGAQMPVFDRNQGKIYSAEAQYSQVLHELRDLRLELNQNLYGFYLQFKQNYYEAHLVTTQLLPLARKAVKLAGEGYRMGRYNYLQLSQSLTSLYEEEKHYQQAHAQFHQALIQITGILGNDEIKRRQGVKIDK